MWRSCSHLETILVEQTPDQEEEKPPHTEQELVSLVEDLYKLSDCGASVRVQLLKQCSATGTKSQFFIWDESGLLT